MFTFEEITAYLDSLPGVLALWWFIENVTDDHPHRTDLFFYCRERVRRYGADGECELAFDSAAFKQEVHS